MEFNSSLAIMGIGGRVGRVLVSIFLMAFGLMGSSVAFAMPSALVLLRHGEKPAQGDGLSAQGWARAQALPVFFRTRPEVTRFGAPAALFAMAPSGPGGSVRAVETLRYVSAAFGVPVQSQFVRDDIQALVNLIVQDHSLDGRLVVICWEHQVLGEIAGLLGVRPQPSYDGASFDRAWILTPTPTGKMNFEDVPERVLPGDSVQ